MADDVIQLVKGPHKIFSSLQGEGATCGAPAVFLRLAGCSLHCRWCDSVDLWQHGEPFTLDEVDKLFDSNGYYFDLLKGAHLVITGGEPMLQQAAIVNLFKRLAEFEREPEKIFIEVETQGTIAPQKEMYGLVRQWNISPKLSNTGLPKEKRLNLDVIRQYAGATNSCFKFPVKDLSDLFEVDQIVKETRIRRTRIYLMPICDTRGNYYVTAPKVAEWAIERGYHFGNRLHLILWDNAPGH